jgi:hypothetical protein
LFFQVLQNAFIFAFLIFIGLYLGNKVGLGVLILKDWLEGKKIKTHLKSFLGISLITGVSTGILIIGIDFLLSIFIQPIPQTSSLPIWVKFLLCFYAAINEEIMTRLCLVTLLVWIFYKIRKENKPSSLSVWLSITISAVLFGIGHLPFTTTLTKLTFFIVIRSIILNGFAGIIFGWLYWKKGLESAIFSHFAADIVFIISPYFTT